MFSKLYSQLISRRSFIASSTALAAASIHGRPRRAIAATSRITIGMVGMGIQNRGHLGWLLGQGGVQVVAVSDCHAKRLADAAATVEKKYAEEKKSGSFVGCAAIADFRELVSRDDIDAVVIGTPDHWHAIPSILAARSGKHVYCEKPLSLTIAESRLMVEAARAGNSVFQTGSQQRTEFGGLFRKAVEYVRSGRIGKVTRISVGVGGPSKPCDLPVESLPEGIDWDMWNGPSPQRGYNAILCPIDIHKHFPQWRSYDEYANGGLADMGAHHFDIAQWAMGVDESGPVEIIPPAEGMTGLRMIYSQGFEIVHGGPSGCTFEGSNGIISVDRGKIESRPGSILETPLEDSDFHLPVIADNHKQNWLDCIATGKRPVADVEVGARTSQICILANMGYHLRRTLKWDPAKEEFINDPQANAMRSRSNRAPWN